MTKDGRSIGHFDVWLEVAAAVDYLSQTHRPGLDVWDALDEAIRWWAPDDADGIDGFPSRRRFALPWNDPDPLRSGIERLLVTVGPAGTPGGSTIAEVFAAAIGQWAAEMAASYNDGHRFGPPG